MSETDIKLMEKGFLLHKELPVMQGAGKKAGFTKSQGAFMKRRTPLLERESTKVARRWFLNSFDPRIELPLPLLIP